MNYPSFYDYLHADIQPNYKNSLAHHGIKGMHWGVRRYQNSDGSLTPDGEKRYLKKLNKASKNEMVSDYFAKGHARNVDRLSEFKRLDPKNYKKQVPKGLLEQERSRMDKWVKRNKKDVENVKKWMDKMNLDKKHLVYDVMTNQYYIKED